MNKSEDTSKILGRIEKLMAMAAQQDASPNEAAIALKRAQALMQKHGLGAEDVALNQVKGEDAGMVSRNNSSLPEYITILIEVIPNVFECRAVCVHGWKGTSVTYYGFGTDSVLAKYALQVLARQLKAARAGYLEKLHHRMKKTNKTKMANSFAKGWILEAGAKAGALRSQMPTDKKNTIKAYTDKHLGELEQVKETSTPIVDKAYYAGIMAAQDVRLHHGVDGTGQLRITP
ncbi:MAG: DUF2786 domain-containing protein [Thiothrix sp.]|uniref:DUF2786 domain-containing protein n=1 Tax=Thiothrix sp. TaxID=1032 RepID=UPI00260D5E03|nr:DUF2786 domain-containing protein [Thiothrix sp.]MDD5395348.1 DUF2786 domain-containing protein [Thiothrix sp.]